MREKISKLSNTDVYEGIPRESRTLDTYYCSHCGQHTSYPVPIEPLYFMDDIYKLIPFPTLSSLKMFLSKHKGQFPPKYVTIYRLPGTGGNRYKRVLTASDVRKLREVRIYRGKIGGRRGKQDRARAPRDDRVWQRGARKEAQEADSGR